MRLVKKHTSYTHDSFQFKYSLSDISVNEIFLSKELCFSANALMHDRKVEKRRYALIWLNYNNKKNDR